jgi:hypothetical protein
MNKSLLTGIVYLITVAALSSFMIKNATGMAGYTGAPGENTCASCHGGGSAAVKGITITSEPEFINDEFYADSTYKISVIASASGFTRYGFDCTILSTSNTSIGTMTLAGTGVKFANALGRRHAVHATPKISSTGTATFQFSWIAPSEGDAKIYAIANAVNGSNTTAGDFVIPPVSMAVISVTPPTPTTVPDGVNEISANAVSKVNVYPNPARLSSRFNYDLTRSATVAVTLHDLTGKKVKTFYTEPQSAGHYSEKLDLQGITAGVYFIRLSIGDVKASQKMVVIE